MSIETLKLCAIVIFLAPMLGAVLAGALGAPLLRGRSHWPAIVGVAIAFAASIVALFTVSAAEVPVAAITLYEWILIGTVPSIGADVLFDPLTAIMLVTVTGVSLMVVIYSRSYMRAHDRPVRGYERYFAFIALFVFSMCALVLSGNFVLLYLGWEAVGLCSYLLIGFYYDRPAAASAAKKAFIVNRVGDFGFGLGILLIYLTIGHLDFQTVFAAVVAAMADGGTGDPAALSALLNVDLAVASEIMLNIQDRVTIIALLLLCGACGKSAQLPLHVWLPDAMEGPSPVSALIHAATMVTAGVYMIARCGAIFTASPTAMTIVAVLGAVTSLFAATIALAQTDLKRILAYSTISQLGLMVLGVGVYAADSAIFHLFTHAFFKALLFLAAGSVMHALGGIIDIRQFSGLRTVLPWTCRLFVIGALALSGFPLLSGFFSKDEIIHYALAAHPLLGVMGLLIAFLTAFYTFRMVFLAFWGDDRVPDGAHPHEADNWMLVPMGVLAIGAIVAGYVGKEGAGIFHGILAPVFEHTFAAWHAAPSVTEPVGFWAHYGLMLLSGAIAVAGVLLAYVIYVREPWIAGLLKATATHTYRVLWNKYYVDEAYDATIVTPARKTANTCVGLDDYFIDGLIWLVTAVPRGVAYLLRPLQSGLLQGYALTMVAGIAILVWLVFVA